MRRGSGCPGPRTTIPANYTAIKSGLSNGLPSAASNKFDENLPENVTKMGIWDEI
jgi:hypothetical protein